MNSPTPQIDAYTKCDFAGPVGKARRSFPVYMRGRGPSVVIMQELPGTGQQVRRFADALVRAGFQVWLPHMYGTAGRTTTVRNAARILFCMRREFQMFSRHQSSAIVDWLRALCSHVKRETNAKGVGVVGMCLSGNFALTLIADDAVLAAVASQPSLPRDQNTLHMSAVEIAASRTAIDAKGPIRAYRFEGDALCSAARFAAIDRAFNDDARRVVLNVMPGPGHAVLTIHFVDDVIGPTATALREVIDYFGRRLR